MEDSENTNSKKPLFSLIGSGISTVGQTIGTVVSSNNTLKAVEAKANLEKELATIAAKQKKINGFLIVGAVFFLFIFLGIVLWSKKPKYFQVGQSMQTYTLSGIHVPKVA